MACGPGVAVEDDGYGLGGLGGSFGGYSGAGGYSIGIVTGSVGRHDRLERLENTFRDALGLPPLD